MAELWPFLKMLRPRAGWALAGLVATLVAAGAGIALMGAVGGTALGAATGVGLAGAGMLLRALALGRGAGRYAEKVATHQATFRVISDLRVWFFERAIPRSPAGLGGVRASELLSRMVSDIDAFDGLYLRLLVPTIAAAILAVPVAWLLGWVAPGVALIALALLAVAGIGVPALAERAGRDAGRAHLLETARLRTASLALIQGLADLTAHQADGRQATHVTDIAAARDRAGRRMSLITALSGAGSQILAQAAVVLVIVLGAAAVQSEGSTLVAVGVAAFVTLAAFELVAPLPVAYQMLGRTRAAARRVLEVADAPPPVADPSDRRSPDGTAITVEDVRFRHPGAGRDTLSGITLTLAPGEHLALTGPSGAGKSTLIDLLVRFHDPDAGRITLGGVDLRSISSAELHARIAVLSQASAVLAGTLRENLLIARPDAVDDDLRQVLAEAGLDTWLAELPAGLDTWLGETGARVSGGQARRVALARVLLKDAPILLLDEPTEGLDAETERQVLAALSRHIEGRSALIVSHRPAAADLARRAVRMEGGLLAASSDRDSRPE